MGSASITQSHRLLKRWHVAIDLIKQLHLLSSDIRAHRGASTALIEGDTFFKPVKDRYERNVRLHLLSIAEDKKSLTTLDVTDAFTSIQKQCSALLLPTDSAVFLDNFSAHCLVLADIQNLIWHVALQADENLIENNDKALMARFLLKYHVDAIESIARLRGFSCALCASSSHSDEELAMLANEIKQVFNSWQKRQDMFNALPLDFYKMMQGIEGQTQITDKLLRFIDTLSPMQNVGAVTPNGSEVYNLANACLNSLNRQYLAGIDHLRTLLPETLVNWIETPVSPYYAITVNT